MNQNGDSKSRQPDLPRSKPEHDLDQQQVRPKVSCCVKLCYFMGLFLETFKIRQHSDITLKQFLLVKAWICHCLITLNRLSQFGTQNSMFLEAQCENCPPYNEELLDHV